MSMSRYLRLLIPCAAILAIALVTPTPATAQAPHTKTRKQAKRAKRAKPPQPGALDRKRAKVRQRIRALRAWRLTEALDLDEKTAARLFPVLNRFDGRFTKGMKAGAALRKAMRRAMRQKASPAKTNKLIDQMVAQQKAHWRLQDERFKAVRAVLTPAQAATILVLLPEIDRKIRRQVRRAMKQRRRPSRPGGRGVKDPFANDRPRSGPGAKGPARGDEQRLINPFEDSPAKRRKRRKHRKRTPERERDGMMNPF